jgi:hypothetical protein
MRVQLRLYIDPGQLEAYVNIKRRDGGFRTVTALIDTGAAVSFLPRNLLSEIEYRVSERGPIVIEQAGIASQRVEATEAYVTLFLEDETSARTPDFEARVWFAETNAALIGFADVLDRAILHVDMPQRSGWLEIDG